MVNAGVQLALWGSVVGVVVTYLMSSFARTLPIEEQQAQNILRLRKRVVKASMKVLLAGPIAMLAFEYAGYEWAADCVDLTPWTGQNT
jgi:predicted ATPase